MMGGGIYKRGSLSLSDVSISGNRATNGPGGGLFNNSASSMSLSNVTFNGNTASGYSGGIHHQGSGTISLTTSPSATIQRTTVAQ